MSHPAEVPDRIESERLLIRAPRLDDVPELVAAVRESLPELSPWLLWATADYDAAGCEASLRRAMAAFLLRQDFRYHLQRKDDGRLVGSTGFHRIDWRVPKMEIGYWCRTSDAGRGYVSEAVRALTEVAFGRLGAARVEIRCDAENRASARVAERCGYRLEGTLAHDARSPAGELRSTLVYARLGPAS